MPTVEEILTDLPRPTFSFRPGYGAPLPEDMTLDRPTAGRTLDPASGLYTSVPSGEHRVFGPQQGLLVEAGARTNFVRHSSDFEGNWNDANTGSSVWGPANNLLDGNENVDAKLVKEKIANYDAGIYGSTHEVLYMIIEINDKSGEIYTKIKGSVDCPRLKVDTDGNVLGASAGVVNTETRTLLENGWNGGKTILAQVRYNPASRNVAGDGRRIFFDPDAGGDGISTYLHHYQVEEATTTSSPIVTGPNEETRSGDDVNIDIYPSKSNERTLFVTFTPRNLFSGSYSPDIAVLGGGRKYLTTTNNSFAKPLYAYDGDNSVKVSNTLEKLQKNRVAISITEDEMRLAANGHVSVGPHNGSLLTSGTLKIGSSNQLHALIHSVANYSKALSESTLETLTS